MNTYLVLNGAKYKWEGLNGLRPASVLIWWDSAITMLSVWQHMPEQCLWLVGSGGGGLQGASHTRNMLMLIVCGHKQHPLPVPAGYFRPLVSLLNFNTQTWKLKKTPNKTKHTFKWVQKGRTHHKPNFCGFSGTFVIGSTFFHSVYFILLMSPHVNLCEFCGFERWVFFQLWFPWLSTLPPLTSVTTEMGNSSETDKLINGHFCNIA